VSAFFLIVTEISLRLCASKWVLSITSSRRFAYFEPFHRREESLLLNSLINLDRSSVGLTISHAAGFVAVSPRPIEFVTMHRRAVLLEVKTCWPSDDETLSGRKG